MIIWGVHYQKQKLQQNFQMNNLNGRIKNVDTLTETANTLESTINCFSCLKTGKTRSYYLQIKSVRSKNKYTKSTFLPVRMNFKSYGPKIGTIHVVFKLKKRSHMTLTRSQYLYPNLSQKCLLDLIIVKLFV